MQFRAALLVAAPKGVKKGVARKDGNPGPAIVAPRVVLKDQQFPFVLGRTVLGRTVLGRQPAGLARSVLARPKGPHAVLGTVRGKVLGKVRREVLDGAEAITARVREAM